jgi:SAM-dependent methyltransferase
MESIDRHQQEMIANKEHWDEKPILRRIYRGFHTRIAGHLPADLDGLVVELGSGVADISSVIPHCLRTDLFPNPWIDQVENAYQLSFADQSLAALILFDVFHHLRYPGQALREFQRVLKADGRVIIFDPGLSLLGRIIFGPLHPEPLGLRLPITWEPPEGWDSGMIDYYASQSNAHRIFFQREVDLAKYGWELAALERYADISYVLSGGYSKPQLYPDRWYGVLQSLDRVCDRFPGVFATRMLVTLRKL